MYSALPELQFMSPVVHKALEFASAAHRGQKRRGRSNASYIAHPALVGIILARAGFPPEVIAAGVLHDVIEDTAVTPEQLTAEFGEYIATIVLAVSEDHAMPYRKKKEQYIASVRAGSQEIKAVSAADKIANLSDIVLQEAAGEQVFKTIWTAGPYQSIELYARMYEAIAENFSHPIVQELKRTLDAFITMAQKYPVQQR